MKPMIARKEVALASGESTYGLQVFRETYLNHGVEEVHWKYDLPDGVVVFALTMDNKVIAIKKWRPGIGEYPQIPAETLEPRELAEFREAMDHNDAAAVNSQAIWIARRCLREETGYESENVQLLTVLSQHSGKTPMVHAFCLALNCTKVQDEGSGQKEEGITLLPLAEVTKAWEMLMAYIRDQPTEPHGGKNSIIAMTLALHRLGLLKVTNS